MQTRLLRCLAGLPLLILEGIGPTPRANAADVPLQVEVTQLQRGDITRSITLPGEVRAYQQVTLCSKVAGYLKRITVDKGDEVKEGALIADIEVPDLVADRVKYKAEVEVAAVDYQRLTQSLKKAPDLVVPQTVDAAKGKLDVAKANLERIETLLAYAKITAPFSGVVTKRMVDPGALVPAATSGGAAQNAAIVTLMDFNKVRVQIAVPEPEVPLVAQGQPVKVSVEELPGRIFDGAITRFAYALDDATKTMLAESELPNPKWELRPGMFASVKIGIERHTDTTLLPVEALLTEKAATFVFSVVDGKAKKLAVKTGFNDGAKVEVLSGVTANDRVILPGKQALTDGQAVTERK